jgi:hypothetical protein
VPAPVIRRDWAGLPPIQRFVGAHPLTAPSDQFSDDLATHQDPSVTADTMGHQVSADAPPGLVLALARPTTRSDGPAMIPRPRVQRSVAGAVTESGEWDGDAAAPDLVRPTPLPISAHTVPPPELPVVAPEPAIQRLTSLPPDAAPTPIAPVAQRSRAVPAPLTMSHAIDEPSEMPPAPAPRLTLGQSRRLGLGAPIRQVPDHNLQRATSIPTLTESGTEMPGPAPTDATKETRAAMDVSPARAPMDLPLVARTRSDVPAAAEAPSDLPFEVRETRTSAPIMGPAPSFEASDEPHLNLPLARPPAAHEPSAGNPPIAPTVQRSATSATEPANDSPSAAPPAVQRLVERSERRRWSTENLTPSSLPTSMPGVASSRLPLVGEPSARVASIPASASLDTAMAPLVGSRLLRPSATLQRSALVAPEDAPILTLPQRESENQATLQQGAGESETTVIQRASEDGPTLALPSTARENAFADSDPTLTLPHSGRANQATPTLTLPQKGREGRAQELPLAPARIAVQRAAQAVDDSETESTDVPIESDAPVVQGAWYDSISAGVGSMTSGVSSSVASSAGSAIGAVASSLGSHKAEETDMDELARKLYDRIRSRLKTELLVDRERAGFLTDLR